MADPRGPCTAKAVWGAAEQGSERSFRRKAETETSGLCDAAGGGTDVLKLDDALASVDDFVAGKQGA